jgi:hypothetical protein
VQTAQCLPLHPIDREKKLTDDDPYDGLIDQASGTSFPWPVITKASWNTHTVHGWDESELEGAV